MKFCKSTIITISFLLLSLDNKAQNWSPLSTGTDWPVLSMFVDTTDNLLYVGGSFVNGGGIGARGIASWNGTTWDTLGLGLDNYPPSGSTSGYPLSMCRYNNELYIGGGFSHAGTTNAHCLAHWNGTAWQSMPVEPNSTIINMMVYGSELYVCGGFDSVGSIPVNGLAKWNGSTWSDVYALPNYNAYLSAENNISCMAFFQGNLYVAGNFEGTSGHKEIVYWDGTQWQPLIDGIYGTAAEIACMAVYQNELYVGGAFTTSAGNVGNYIQKWNGTTWTSVGGGVMGLSGGNGQVLNMKVINGKLYAVGVFETAGSIPAERIASWDGTKWCGYGSTFNNRIDVLEFFHDSIYIGGGFTSIDGAATPHIAKWIGGNYVDTCSIDFTGIEQLSVENTINLYPNPSSDQITIELSEAINQTTALQIKNTLGQILKTIQLTKGNKQLDIDISDLAPGFYFVQMQNGNRMISKKFIKQ